mgnify:CR=1 FL=1
MHTFQKITPDIVEINPFEKIGKDWMLVTAGNEEKANTKVEESTLHINIRLAWSM